MKWSVVGHREQKAVFERLLAEGRLAHAYLLGGPDGVGKRAFVREFASAMLGSPLPLDANPDFLELREPPVEVVREQLRPWTHTKPLYGTRKVAVIDDVERLGGEAANTFLKVLEEPPEYLTFFLISSRPRGVMATIASRCQAVQFSALETKDMDTVLASQKLKADDRNVLKLVVAGRPGAALKLVVEDRLKDAARSIVALQKAMKSSIAERINLAKAVADADDPAQIAFWWLSFVHARLAEKPYLAPIATGLLRLHETLSDSRFNRRLAIERFLFALPQSRIS